MHRFAHRAGDQPSVPMIVRQVPLNSLALRAPMEMSRGHADEDWSRRCCDCCHIGEEEPVDDGADAVRRGPGGGNATAAA